MAALPTHTMLLSATELSLSYDYLCLLDKVSIAIRSGEKIGLVGRNGCGKSSLLKILAQESSADSGDCSRRKGLRVGYLPQAFELNESLSVRDNILEGASDVLAWIREYESGQGTEAHQATLLEKSIWQMAGTLSPVPPMPPPFSPLLPWIVR